MFSPQQRSGRPLTLEGLCLERQLLSPAQAGELRRFCQDSGANFGTAAMYLRFIDGEVLGSLLELGAGIRHVHPAEIVQPVGIKNLFPPEQAKALQIFPLSFVQDSGQRILLLGMTDPLDSSTVARAQGICRVPVQSAFVTLDELQALFKRYYRSGLALFPPETTSAGQKTVNRRIDALVDEPRRGVSESVSKAAAPSRDREHRALVALLVEKGLITEEEYRAELERHR